MSSTAETRSIIGRASQYRTSSRIAPSKVVLTARRDLIREPYRVRGGPDSRHGSPQPRARRSNPDLLTSGAPIDLGRAHGPATAKDRLLVNRLADQIRTQIQDMIDDRRRCTAR